jgi:hypothetical protein
VIALWLTIGLLTGASPAEAPAPVVTPPTGGFWSPVNEDYRRKPFKPADLIEVAEPVEVAEVAPKPRKRARTGQESLALLYGIPSPPLRDRAAEKARQEAVQAAFAEAKRQELAARIKAAQDALAKQEALAREEAEMAAILLVMLSAV